MAFACILQGSIHSALSYKSHPCAFPSLNKPLRALKQIRPITCKKKTDDAGPKMAQYGLSKPLKARLKDGERLYGVFLLSFSPVVAEIVGFAGYDFAVIDMEHGPGDTMAALPVMQALASTQTPAIIRIPDNDPVMVKKAMDLGPQGLMFPMIDGPKAAKRAVSYCRYPPKGIRGAAHSVVRASRYGVNDKYLEEYEDEVLVMCQVESEEAVKKIEEIAMVEGVDCIQMGPTDLSASMGFLNDLGNKRAKEMLQRAEKGVFGLKNGPFLAGFAMPHDPPTELQRRGYHMVSGAVDIGLFRDAAIADLRKHKSDVVETEGGVHQVEVLDEERELEAEKLNG